MSIIVDQLRISDDGKRMYLNVHVNKASYFDNIYLDSITIMTADKVSETAPDAPTEDYIYKLDLTDSNHKEADLVLRPTDMNEQFLKSNFSQDLFFIYIKVRGVPDECTPCRLDEETTLAVTFDENLLYQRVMEYTKQLADTCSVQTGFTDFILTWNAFKAAVETEHFIPAIKFYNLLFGKDADGYPYGPYGSTDKVILKGCGCNE